MGNEYIIQGETLTNIANAIREKSGKTDLILVSSMADEISNISGGGGVSDEQVKYVTFMYGETELYKQPVISGDTVRDPVAKGYIEAPTKEQTVSTVYTYNGWSLTNGGSADSTALQNVTEDRVVYAAFAESARMYTVNFYDGETLVHTEQVGYGGSSSYTYTKNGYTFKGWSPEPTNITSDTNCYAQWMLTPTFAGSSWADIAELCAEGEAQTYFKLGDKKALTFTNAKGEELTVNMIIVGFNHDDLADGTGKASLSLLTDECLYSSNFHSANYLLPMDYHSYILQLLPDEVKQHIKSVSKTWTNNFQDPSALITYARSAWAPTATEILGDNDSYYAANQGVKYDYFTSDERRISKINTTGEAHRYITSSFRKDSGTNGVMINETGAFESTAYAGAPFRFGFCI